GRRLKDMRIRRLIGFALPTLIAACGLPGIAPVRASLGTAPPHHSVYFAGLADGHLYRSTTGISDWQEADHGLPTKQGIFALAVTPDGSTIYAGPASGGIYTSSDGGMHWTNDNGNNPILAKSWIVSLVVDPTDSHVAYALSEETFFVSRDAGRTWLA